MSDIVQKIMAYEAGELDDEHALALFQELVDTGMDMELQGSYGRTAARLIADGLIRGPWDEDE